MESIKSHLKRHFQLEFHPKLITKDEKLAILDKNRYSRSLVLKRKAHSEQAKLERDHSTPTAKRARISSISNIRMFEKRLLQAPSRLPSRETTGQTPPVNGTRSQLTNADTPKLRKSKQHKLSICTKRKTCTSPRRHGRNKRRKNSREKDSQNETLSPER